MAIPPSYSPPRRSSAARAGCGPTQPRRGARAWLWALALCTPAAAFAGEVEDLTQLSLEQLLTVEVVVTGASKFEQRSREAPASISVLTADDIRTYGWRTLADALRSVRGFHLNYDRIYSFVGVRGFNRNDYNSRVVVLVDGQRLNDPIYDQAFLGTEFILDLELVERIEVVRGPVSSIYGSTALLGIVNIVTKRGSQVDGPQLAAEAASFDTYKGRVSAGGRNEQGLDWLVSASRYTSGGQALHFPEFDAPETNGGDAHGTDFDRYTRLFGKLAWGELGLTAAHAERVKGIPSGVFGTLFNDPGTTFTDRQRYLRVDYRTTLGDWAKLNAAAWHGDYRFEGHYAFPDLAGTLINRESSHGRWAGGELQLLAWPWQRHRLALGIEAQRYYRQEISNYDEEPFALYVDVQRQRTHGALYIQDEFTVAPALALTGGLRLDTSSNTQPTLSPRLAAVFEPDSESVAKLLYGSAFRTPSVFERYYDAPGEFIANPTLQPERIRSLEATYDRTFGGNLRALLGAYRYKVDRTIDSVPDLAAGGLQFRNGASLVGQGLEAEIEASWNNGARLRASAALQRARWENGSSLTNAPRRLAKANLSVPIAGEAARLALETHYTSRRQTDLGNVGGFALSNLVLSRIDRAHGYELSFGIYNLFDKRYADPVKFDTAVPTRDALTQDGRSFRAQLSFRF